MLPIQDFSLEVGGGNRVMRWLLTVALAAALIAFLVPGANADSMSVSYRGNQGISYYVDGNNRNTVTAEFYSSVEFQSKMWFGYCMDPAQGFASPIEMGPPEAWNGPDNVYPPVTNSNWREAAWLVENYAPGVNWVAGAPVDYGSATVRAAIQAVQMAVWEIVMDPSLTYSEGNLQQADAGDRGRFYVKTGYDTSLAGQMLVALSEHKAENPEIELNKLDFLIGDSANKQDLLMGTGGGVPEPGTMLLLGSALGVAGYWRRRRAALKPA